MPAMTEPKLISGNANKPLASAIARRDLSDAVRAACR